VRLRGAATQAILERAVNVVSRVSLNIMGRMYLDLLFPMAALKGPIVSPLSVVCP
jgi:hypothetical protein